MAEKTLYARLKHKTDTSANWRKNNPVLLAGEMGIESDTNKFKFGNGVNNWNDLSYVVSGGEGGGNTTVTVDGIPQTVWEANTKVNKSGDTLDGQFIINGNYLNLNPDWLDINVKDGLSLTCVRFKADDEEHDDDSYEYYLTLKTDYESGKTNVWSKKGISIESDYEASLKGGTTTNIEGWTTNINGSDINISAGNYLKLLAHGIGVSSSSIWLDNDLNISGNDNLSASSNNSLSLKSDKIEINSTGYNENDSYFNLKSAHNIRQISPYINLEASKDANIRSENDTVISSGGETKMYGDVVLLSKNEGDNEWATGRYYYNDGGTKYEVYSPLNPPPSSTSEPASETNLGVIRAWIDNEGVICFSTQQKPNIPTANPIFGDNSWKKIGEVSAYIKENALNSAQVKELFGWSIGDEKNETLTTGEEVTFQILGYNHDELAEEDGNAGITLGLKNCLTTAYRMGTTGSRDNWEQTEMRTTTLPLIYDTLSDDLKMVIKTANKKSRENKSSDELIMTKDNLFLFSVEEVVGSIYNGPENAETRLRLGVEGEGKQYEYYRTAIIPSLINPIHGQFTALLGNEGTFYYAGDETTAAYRVYTDSFGIQAQINRNRLYDNYNCSKSAGNNETSAFTWWMRSLADTSGSTPMYAIYSVSSSNTRNLTYLSTSPKQGLVFGFCI